MCVKRLSVISSWKLCFFLCPEPSEYYTDEEPEDPLAWTPTSAVRSVSVGGFTGPGVEAIPASTASTVISAGTVGSGATFFLRLASTKGSSLFSINSSMKKLSEVPLKGMNRSPLKEFELALDIRVGAAVESTAPVVALALRIVERVKGLTY